jgi:hypothetical protein
MRTPCRHKLHRTIHKLDDASPRFVFVCGGSAAACLSRQQRRRVRPSLGLSGRQHPSLAGGRVLSPMPVRWLTLTSGAPRRLGHILLLLFSGPRVATPPRPTKDKRRLSRPPIRPRTGAQRPARYLASGQYTTALRQGGAASARVKDGQLSRRAVCGASIFSPARPPVKVAKGGVRATLAQAHGPEPQRSNEHCAQDEQAGAGGGQGKQQRGRLRRRRRRQ